MSSNSTNTGSSDDDYDISDTEWVVIVVVLVIVLIVLIITVAKCLEIGKPDKSDKSLIQNDFQSVRSGNTTVRSVASSKKMKKMPLNAEITRFSAGRQSRSAEYGVVIKDIGKAAQTDGQPTPPHYQHSNTLPRTVPVATDTSRQTLNANAITNLAQTTNEPRYVQHSQVQPRTVAAPPNGAVIVDREYATTGHVKPNSKAVFVAPEDPYYNGVPQVARPAGHGIQTLPSQAAVPVQLVDVGNTYQVVPNRAMATQPVILMQ